MPPACGAELATDVLRTLLEQQQLGMKLRATSEPLSEASPASCQSRTRVTRGAAGQGCSGTGDSNTPGASGRLRKGGKISRIDSSLQNECLGAQKRAIRRESLHPEAIKRENV